MSALVLVVDDDRLNREVLRRAVEAAGYLATTAADGRAALAQLRDPGPDGPVDVVLLDLVMPVLDGFGTLRAIKAEPALQHLPVIMVSAVADDVSAVRSIELGATDYLTKPVKAPLLRARLRTSLATKRLRDVELDHLEQVDRVGRAAVALEDGRFEPDELRPVAARDDALGTLARVFTRMAHQVAAREAALRAEVDELRIEIDRARRERQVAEVTGSERYRQLSSDAVQLNRILRGGGADDDS
ncbi:response regulator [Nitriliruptor alkaliphilus]|uniref:response regulator n=1 Tax=Nitriliruptor alkaliphilus TaxID=427918 RepID=UPI0006991670|nr:response regulator [Nitriliruptor alkaliphilus]